MSNFDKAFASARKGGKKVFSFGGKSYNTKLASDAPAKKKSTLPSSVSVPPKRPMMVNQPGKSAARDYDVDGMAHSYKTPSVPPSGITTVPSGSSSAPFLKHTVGSNSANLGTSPRSRSQMNDFKQTESRQSADYQIGKAYKS